MVAGQLRPPRARPPLSWPGRLQVSRPRPGRAPRATPRLRRAGPADPAPGQQPGRLADRPRGGRQPTEHARSSGSASAGRSGRSSSSPIRPSTWAASPNASIDRNPSGTPVSRSSASSSRSSPVSTRAPTSAAIASSYSTGGSACPPSFAANPSASSTARNAASRSSAQSQAYASPSASTQLVQRQVAEPVRLGRGGEPLSRRRVPVGVVEDSPASSSTCARCGRLSGPSRLLGQLLEQGQRGIDLTKSGVDAGQQVPAAVGLVLGAEPIQTEHGLLGDLGGLGGPAHHPVRVRELPPQERVTPRRPAPRTASPPRRGRPPRPGPGRPPATPGRGRPGPAAPRPPVPPPTPRRRRRRRPPDRRPAGVRQAGARDHLADTQLPADPACLVDGGAGLVDAVQLLQQVRPGAVRSGPPGADRRAASAGTRSSAASASAQRSRCSSANATRSCPAARCRGVAERVQDLGRLPDKQQAFLGLPRRSGSTARRAARRPPGRPTSSPASRYSSNAARFSLIAPSMSSSSPRSDARMRQPVR